MFFRLLVLVFAFVVIVAGVFALWPHTGTALGPILSPRTAATTTPYSTPSGVSVQATTSPSEQNTAQSAQTAAATTPATIRVELTEAQVNDMLKQRLSKDGYQVDDLNVRLESGRFEATTSQQVGFFQVPVTIVGEASVVDGQIVAHLDSVSAAGMPVPKDVTDRLVSVFEKELSAQLATLPVRPTSLQIEPGRLIVEGTPK